MADAFLRYLERARKGLRNLRLLRRLRDVDNLLSTLMICPLCGGLYDINHPRVKVFERPGGVRTYVCKFDADEYRTRLKQIGLRLRKPKPNGETPSVHAPSVNAGPG